MIETENSPTSITVLIVDDQPVIVEVIRRMLAPEESMEFFSCTESKHALEIARQVLPTVILQDLSMPEIDGFELLQHYHDEKLTRDVPVIMLTGKEDAETKASAFAMGPATTWSRFPRGSNSSPASGGTQRVTSTCRGVWKQNGPSRLPKPPPATPRKWQSRRIAPRRLSSPT